MPDKNTRSVPEGATQQVAEMMAALRSKFAAWTSEPLIREFVRLSMAGEIPRRTLMEAAYAKGFGDGAAFSESQRDGEASS